MLKEDGLGWLSEEQKISLFKLLSDSKQKDIGLDNFLREDIKYGIASAKLIENIYKFRRDRTTNANIKSQLINLVDNLSTFVDDEILLIFFGEETNRTMAFTDLNFQILLGLVNKNAP